MSGRLLGPIVQEAVPDDALLRTYRVGARTGVMAMGGGFRLLMGFHVQYSRILLNAARRGVMK
jgi:hypothetical protein